jgi:hypothetical protein
MRWLLSPDSPEMLKFDSVMGTGDVDPEYHDAV